jgi:hypothetical protein
VDQRDELAVLRSIDRRLALLTGKEERDVRRALIADVLTTPARVAMWDAIDGKIGSPDLAKLAKVSERAAQLFAKDLLDAGLVTTVTGARGNVVEKDQDAVVQWYLRRAAAE